MRRIEGSVVKAAYGILFVVALVMALAGGIGPAAADNSCIHARDGQCDEPDVGTGACPMGTDSLDCLGIGNNTCTWAFDGECDEPGIGTNNCKPGTDSADCRGSLAPKTSSTDSCLYANDGECDEIGIGTGACEKGTDATDCGRAPTTDAPTTGTTQDPAADAQAALCSRIYSGCLATCPMFSGALALTRCQSSCSICYVNCQSGLAVTCVAPPSW